MGVVARSPVAPVVGAVEVLDFRVRVVDVEMQLTPTASAEQQPRKHILFNFLGLTPLVPLPGALYHFPRLTVNNCLVDTLKNHLIFLGVLKASLVFE